MATGPSKNILQSKTIWGAIILIVAPLLSRYGLEIEADMAESSIQEAIDIISAAVGGLLVVWGRLTAKKGVTIL